MAPRLEEDCTPRRMKGRTFESPEGEKAKSIRSRGPGAGFHLTYMAVALSCHFPLRRSMFWNRMFGSFWVYVHPLDARGQRARKKKRPHAPPGPTRCADKKAPPELRPKIVTSSPTRQSIPVTSSRLWSIQIPR